jgi:hypothetical protein
MCVPHPLIATYKSGQGDRLRSRKRGVPTGAMFDGCDRFAVRAFVLLDDAMADKLLVGDGMLAVREPREVFFLYPSGEAELFS